MKRVGFLYEQICDIDNLRLAYLKAKRGKAHKFAVLAYGRYLDKNLLALQEVLIKANVPVGQYNYFTIYDPKERVICAASFEERVLHHALMNVCHPYFEQKQYYHSYATRVGKGTYAALEYAQVQVNKYKWFLKLDFRKYFDSIDQSVLKAQLSNLFKDSRLVELFSDIIDSYHSTGPGKGLPIGNLTSQYFANHYLQELDHKVKRCWGAPAYLRYMDDMVIFSDSKAELLSFYASFAKHSEGILQLTLNPLVLNRVEAGLPFLGYRLRPGSVRLSRNSTNRFKRKFMVYCAKLRTGEWSQKTFQNHVNPLLAFVNKADTMALRTKLNAEFLGWVP